MRVLLFLAIAIFSAHPEGACADETFRNCLSQEIAILDDGISSADVIAAGVVRECMEQHPAKDCTDETCLTAEANFLKVRVLPEVLKYRAAKRASPKP